MRAIYKIREFLSYKGFNLIKVYFSVHYSACVCYQMFNAKLFRETLPVALAVSFNTASTVMMSANMLQRHILEFPLVRDTADCVSSGCLREVKNN